MPSLLVIEDDASVAGNLVQGLRRQGFAIELATDGALGLLALERADFDLVVLDLMLPRVDGFEVLQRLRECDTSVPVIVLSARSDLPERLRTFELGAVDFVAKPFWLEELAARIRTRLRIEEEAPRNVIEWSDVCLDLDARSLSRAGVVKDLTRAELDILIYLARRRGRSVSRETIASAALRDPDTQGRTVDTHVARIRRKLGEEAAASIQTVWGIGYRFGQGDA